MRFKLDECLDERLAIILGDAGHDVLTIRGQNLKGVDDRAIYEICKAEKRILVSWDKDYSNVLRYPPHESPGIVVLRGPNDLFSTMRLLVKTLIEALKKESPSGKLWIVEPERLRIHQNPLV